MKELANPEWSKNNAQLIKLVCNAKERFDDLNNELNDIAQQLKLPLPSSDQEQVCVCACLCLFACGCQSVCE